MDESLWQTRVILFDFGGVIAAEGFYGGLEQIALDQGLAPKNLPQIGVDAMYASGYVTGRASECETLIADLQITNQNVFPYWPAATAAER